MASHKSFHGLLPEEQLALQSPIKIEVGYSHEGLILKKILETTEKESNTDRIPHIDVIHIIAAGAEELNLYTLFPASAVVQMREFLFQFDISNLLVGNMIDESIDYLARRLLRSLIFFQQHDEQRSKRTRIFVAYGFGALIIKKAICIAGAHEREWPGIFMGAAQFIFAGCFQRTNDTDKTIFFKMLKNLASQAKTLVESSASVSIKDLAKYTMETTEAFVVSKITLRSQIISLYANSNKPGRISDVFDRYTATIGVPGEIALQEQIQEGEKPILDLCATARFNVKYRIPHESMIPFERTLLALTPAHRPLTTTYLDSHSIFRSTERKKWMSSAGAHILYVCGNDYSEVKAAAEQVFIQWANKRREHTQNEKNTASPFSFVFSSRDPLRCSMKGMLCSLMLSYFSCDAINTTDEYYRLMKDQFVLQHAWTEIDLFKIFTAFAPEIIRRDMMLLLEDIDQCDERSREAFWTALNTFASTTEVPVKVVVTSRRPLDLLHELRQRPDIQVDTYFLDDREKVSSTELEDAYPDGLILTLCPRGLGETAIRQMLEKLRPMERKTLESILGLIKDLTNWPQDTSHETLHEFRSRLEAVTLNSTPANILESVLQDIKDQQGFQWTLNWLLDSQRPLSYNELAMLLCYFKTNLTFDAPSLTELRESSSQLQTWFRGMTESCSGQVCLRDDVRGHLQDMPNNNWKGSEPSKSNLEFLLSYLTSPLIQSRIGSMSSQYLSLVESSSNEITPPLVQDGHDIIFFAIQALPYHLSKSPGILRSIQDILVAEDGKLTPWSRAYWAMSNPFSRPKSEAIKSPYEALLALGNLGPEAVAIMDEMEYSKGQVTVDAYETSTAELDSLSNAIREGNEDAALSLAAECILAFKTQGKTDRDIADLNDSSKIAWPSWFLWRAVWLNMNRLVARLLDGGMDPEPTDGASEFFPSPLHMATRLCHSRVMDTLIDAPMDALIDHGAGLDVKKPTKSTLLYDAAYHGNIHGVNRLEIIDRSLLESQQPETPLYAASLNGNWKVVKRLFELGADPDSAPMDKTSNWLPPLAIAVEMGHIQTARILLENEADPNSCGSCHGDTPLRIAAVKTVSVEMVRLLLAHGANPKHKVFDDSPLLIQIIQSAMSINYKLEMLNILGQALVNITDGGGMTPLMHAAERGELLLMKWLLEHKAKFNATDKKGRSALYHAVQKMHAEAAKMLLNPKTDLNKPSNSGETLLEIAISSNRILQMLLDYGAKVDSQNENGQSAIHVAVIKRKPAAVKLLVEKQANIHLRDLNGRSPIMYATETVADAKIIRILAEANANLNDDDNSTGRSLLHYAMTKDTEIAKTLLEFHNRINLEKRDTNRRTPLLLACRNGSIKHVKLMIQAGADINAQDNDGWTALSYVADRWLPLEAADLLLTHKDLKINTLGEARGTALMVACRSLNVEMVTKLLENRANPNITLGCRHNNTALKIVCTILRGLNRKDTESIDKIVRQLIASGAEINTMVGSSIGNAICAASFSARLSTIQLLHENGASFQSPDPLGRLPIHYAAANGIRNFEAVSQIHKGDLMVSDHAGKTVLHWAAQFGRAETVKAILKYISRNEITKRRYINQVDVDGWTPLCWASRPLTKDDEPNLASEKYEQAETVECLVEQGADIAVQFTMGTGQDVETFTPLKMATLCGADERIIDKLGIAKYSILMLNSIPESNLVGPDQKYRCRDRACDICLNSVFGPIYVCQSCDDFYACKKCYGRISMYHIHPNAFTKVFGQEVQHVSTPYVSAKGDDKDNIGFRECQVSRVPDRKEPPKDMTASEIRAAMYHQIHATEWP